MFEAADALSPMNITASISPKKPRETLRHTTWPSEVDHRQCGP